MSLPDPSVIVGVQDLFARYAHTIDRRDFDAFADLFTADGRLGLGDTGAEGRGAIHDFMQGVMKNPGGAHIITNVSARAAGDDRYTVVADYLLTRRADGDGPWAVVGVGIYESTVVLDDGDWRFAEHRIVAR
jgi:uncharacterized protein (TIGR02246 family)